MRRAARHHIVALLWPNLDDRETIFIEISILIVLMLAFDWLPIRIWLVPVHVKHAHTRQLAAGQCAIPDSYGCGT